MPKKKKERKESVAEVGILSKGFITFNRSKIDPAKPILIL